eukprot:COSAG06_NODE_838_length_12005_cov_473.630354_17_plen_92_part_00
MIGLCASLYSVIATLLCDLSVDNSLVIYISLLALLSVDTQLQERSSASTSRKRHLLAKSRSENDLFIHFSKITMILGCAKTGSGQTWGDLI